MINIDKCKYIIINDKNGTRGKRISINDITLERVEKIKYLGVLLDERVKFEMHAKYIMNKISKQTHLLSKLGKNLSFYTKLLLYKSMIAPQFIFCSTILNGLPDYLIREL